MGGGKHRPKKRAGLDVRGYRAVETVPPVNVHMRKAAKSVLPALYVKLLNAFGPQQWWPAQTKFEVMVGAILTQNTNWGNVEKAINNLKSQGPLSPNALKNISLTKLAALIKPAGYFNVKAVRLKNFISFFFSEYNGRLEKMAKEDPQWLRQKLLGVKGIGPETADSILLYALDKPVFVVDAYTKRILYRHNLAGASDDYHSVQETFVRSLKQDVRLFNEYHALIVRLGKDYCKPHPRCQECVLKDFHYSLTEKCSGCHRALPVKEERRPFGKGFLCSRCFENR